ncbi:MAG: KamA family radical SAM protein [bacterium]
MHLKTQYGRDKHLNFKRKYKSYALQNFTDIPQIKRLPEQLQFDMKVVAQVLPFKTNNYVVEKLINWQDVPHDPMFKLTFPQRDMLLPEHFEEIERAIIRGKNKAEIEGIANKIRLQLNPHPGGQLEHNVPELNGKKLSGLQHKYRETVLFFPSQGQTCHAYCSFCFRWPQFVGMDEYKFAMRETELLVAYLKKHPEVTDVLFTGGDPMIMKPKLLTHYMNALLDADLPHLKTIRIGSKSLSFWPYKFIEGSEGDEIISLFKRIVDSGKHLAFMAHFSHPIELSTRAVRAAIKRIQGSGAQIRTQSPILRHINDRADVWVKMWRKQVHLGCIPYYMFVVRDTGAQHYFGVPLVRAWCIYRKAIQQVSGLARTVRGPSMSATQGKIQIVGVNEINGEKVLVLNMLQARKPELAMRPYFVKYNENALWVDDLEALDGKKFRFTSPRVDFNPARINTYSAN